MPDEQEEPELEVPPMDVVDLLEVPKGGVLRRLLVPSSSRFRALLTSRVLRGLLVPPICSRRRRGTEGRARHRDEQEAEVLDGAQGAVGCNCFLEALEPKWLRITLNGPSDFSSRDLLLFCCPLGFLFDGLSFCFS